MATTLTTTKESPDKECQKFASRLISGVGSAVATVMMSASAQAADWRVSPTVDVSSTYTDNVRLAPRGAEKGDLVGSVTPGVSVSRDGPGLRVNARYGLQYVTRASDSEGSTLSHQLSATANAELVKNLFFVDSSASISQQNISALGPQAVDNISVTDNRATVRAYSISPYVRQRFGNTATSEARYTYTAVSSSSGALSRSQTDALSLNLNSGPAFRSLGWGLQYGHQKYHFSDANSTDSTSVSASLRYMVTPQFSLNTSVGYDKYNYDSISDASQGRYYSVGFSWRPTERTSISASTGRRFYGKTYSLQSSVRSRSSLWSASYIEDITTAQAQTALQGFTRTADFLNLLFSSSIPDPVARQQFVDRFILVTGLPPVFSRSTNYFSNQFFLQKSLQGTVAITGAKNTVVFTVFNTSRVAQTALSSRDSFFGTTILNLDANTRQTGVNGMWNWRVNDLMNATASAGYTRTRQDSSNAEQRQKIVTVALSTRILPKVDGGVQLRRQMQNSDIAASDYVEHAVTAYLSMRF
jgi:uncharacterized protein (PEP-CTERM system associated)